MEAIIVPKTLTSSTTFDVYGEGLQVVDVSGFFWRGGGLNGYLMNKVLRPIFLALSTFDQSLNGYLMNKVLRLLSPY